MEYRSKIDCELDAIVVSCWEIGNCNSLEIPDTD